MTALQAPDTHAYGVLGVSPNASVQEIDAAFHRLIEEGGYRIGVPLHGQWQRAREIKEAYATLRDPPEPSAFDESPKEAAERPLWPADPHNPPAADPLVRPLSEEQPPPETTLQSTTAALSSADREPEYAPAGAIESGHDEIVPSVYQQSPRPEEPSRNEVKYGSAKLWGSAAAATLALGSLFYFTWPIGRLQPNPEIAAQLPAGTQQVNSGVPMTGRLTKLPPAVVDAPGATETELPSAATTKVAIANETQTLPGAPAALEGEAGSATAPALTPVSSGQTSTAAEAAGPAPASVPPHPQAPSIVLPIPVAAQPQVRTSVTAQPGASIVSQPQWVSGGPTHLDNRRGRYVGSVIVQFTVQPDGRVSNCGPVRGSGNADLDAFTCRLVEERMRFKPALDAHGTPVASTAHARYEWGRRRRHPGLLSWIFR